MNYFILKQKRKNRRHPTKKLTPFCYLISIFKRYPRITNPKKLEIIRKAFEDKVEREGGIPFTSYQIRSGIWLNMTLKKSNNLLK